MAYVETTCMGREGTVAIVTLNRPETRNAFHTQMALEIEEAFRSLAGTDARVVILTSSSEHAFCSGADLKERMGLTDEEWRAQHEKFEQMFNTIAEMPQPIIAEVDGFALAGGFELALNCDFMVAAETAMFGLPEVTRGIIPGGGSTRLLAKRIGVHRAKEWICTGRMITAREANEAGLLNQLTSRSRLRKTVLDMAEMIAKNAPIAVQQSKQAVETLFGMEPNQARKIEMTYYDKCLDTRDREEGVRAFVEKRTPRFIGQ